MSSERAVLETENLTKQFGSHTALRSASLRVAPGESLTIFGRNGAGKTTFLKIVATLIRSYRGSARLFGEDLKSADDALRGRIGFVSHESYLYPDLTVRDNLRFYAKMYRLRQAETAVKETIARMDLEAKAASLARTLSRGMKQRLSLGRAFLHRPDLLLLDEPFTGLDERAAEILDRSLAEFKGRGGSMVMATHNAERGWKHADRVAVLERGAVVYETSLVDTTYEEFHSRYREILAH